MQNGASGQPDVAVIGGGLAGLTAAALDLRDGRIAGMRVVVNPDKLRRVPALR